MNASEKPWAVTRDANAVTLLGPTGAVVVRLSTEGQPDGHAKLISSAPGAPPSEIFSGPIVAAAAQLDAIAKQAATARTDRAWMPIAAITAVAASAVIILGLSAYIALRPGQQTADPTRDAAYTKLLESLQSMASPTRPMMPPNMSQNLPQNLPPGLPPQVASASPSQPPHPAVEPSAPAQSIPVPKDLPPIIAAPSPAASTTQLASVQPKDALTAPQPPLIVPVKPSAETAAPQAAINGKPEPKAEPNAKSEIKSEAKSEDMSASKPDGKPEDKAVAETTLASGDKPMTPAQAQQLLQTLEKLRTKVSSGDEIPPEILKQLPNEIAKRLVATGVATLSPTDRREAAQRLARVVRLPSEVVTARRGPDGIPDVTESNFWAANSGKISIPLPGGGDIRSPDVLKQFGLQP